MEILQWANSSKSLSFLMQLSRNENMPSMIFLTILLSMYIFDFYVKWRAKQIPNHSLSVLNVDVSNEASNSENVNNR